jgi:hypothetical protein
MLKRFIWILFFTQPFWGFFLPTSVPFWIAIFFISLIIKQSSNNEFSLIEKLLFSFVVLSFIGWYLGNQLHSFAYNSASRDVLQHFIFAFSILLTIQSANDVENFLIDSKWFIWGTLIFSFFSILSGSFFNTSLIDSSSGFERAGGWIGIPNAYSTFLVFAIILCFYHYKIKLVKIYKYLLVPLFIFLLLTLSRNGFIAIIIFFIYFTNIFSFKDKLNSKTLMFRNITKYLVILSIITFIFFSNFQNIIEGAFNRDIDFSQGELQNARILFWGAQLMAVSQWNGTQYLVGVNYDNILENLEHGLGYRFPNEVLLKISPVENGFLYTFIGSGAIGFIILILMIIKSWKNLNRPELNEKFVRFIKGMILAMIVQAMFMDFMYLGIKTYYLVFMGLSYKYLKIKIESSLSANNLKIE